MIRGAIYVTVFVGLPLLAFGTATYALASVTAWMSVRARVVLAVAAAVGFVLLVYSSGPEWLQRTTFSIAPGLVVSGGIAFILVSICFRRITTRGRIITASVIAFTVLWTLQTATLDGFEGPLCALILSDHSTYASNYTVSGFRQVQVGMTKEEVQTLLGRPLDEWTVPRDPGPLYWRWSRSRDGSRYYRYRVVNFAGDRVADKSAFFYCHLF